MATPNSYESAIKDVKAGKKTEPLLTTVWRILRLLKQDERKMVLPLAIVTTISSILDLAGIAIVIPIVGVAVKPEMVSRSPRLGQIYEWSGASSGLEFVEYASILMLILVTAKVLLSIAVQYWQTKFAFVVAHRLSGVMWDYNFAQSLENVVNRSSGKILTEINGWPMQFAKRGLFGVIALASDFLILTAFGIALLMYKPLIIVTIASIVGLGSIFLRAFVKHRVASYSEIQKEEGPKAMGVLNNSVRGIREIVTFNAVETMKKEYLESNWINFNVNSNLFLLNLIPKPLYEWLAILSISAAIFISMNMSIRNEDFLSMLTFLALGSYRMLPAVSKISQRAIQIQSSAFVVEAMEQGLAFRKIQTEEAQKNITSDAGIQSGESISIELRNLKFQYTGKKKATLEDLSFLFPAGQITAITGRSGSGKTTLINCLMGLNKPQSGEIVIHAKTSDKSWVLGEDLSRTNWLKHTTFLSQQPFLFPGTIRDNLTMKIPTFQIDEERVSKLIENLGMKSALEPEPDAEPDTDATPTKSALDFVLKDGGANLSGGQQQRVGLLRSIQVRRPVMILDEATSDLDSQTRDAVFELLEERKREGCTILIITHDRKIVERCDANLDLTPVKK